MYRSISTARPSAPHRACVNGLLLCYAMLSALKLLIKWTTMLLLLLLLPILLKFRESSTQKEAHFDSSRIVGLNSVLRLVTERWDLSLGLEQRQTEWGGEFITFLSAVSKRLLLPRQRNNLNWSGLELGAKDRGYRSEAHGTPISSYRCHLIAWTKLSYSCSYWNLGMRKTIQFKSF